MSVTGLLLLMVMVSRPPQSGHAAIDSAVAARLMFGADPPRTFYHTRLLELGINPSTHAHENRNKHTHTHTHTHTNSLGARGQAQGGAHVVYSASRLCCTRANSNRSACRACAKDDKPGGSAGPRESARGTWRAYTRRIG